MLSPQDFRYNLPPELIAQTPAPQRDHSRLLVVDRSTGSLSHHHFYELPSLLRPTDVIVRNNTKVMPARIWGQKTSGGKVEILLNRLLSAKSNTAESSPTWECLTKPGLKLDQIISFPGSDLSATCIAAHDYTRTLEFNVPLARFWQMLDQIGQTPLPPYIAPPDGKTYRQRYQTTFAQTVGSAAAPTAGLHFTPQLDEQLRQKGIDIHEVTLHVGLGTFLPVKSENIATHQLHHEWFELSSEVAQALNTAKRAGRRIIAVGTTTTRVLETCAQDHLLRPTTGTTNIFIYPPYQFKFIDGLITNFHLPESSLLMLVAALVTTPNTTQPFTTFANSMIGTAYQVAMAERYRFFSFGDVMLIE